LETLKKATFNRLTTIEDGASEAYLGTWGAFYNSGIQEFNAPELTTIGKYAFAKLKDVTKVSLRVPIGVKIAQNAFDSQDKYEIVQP
ncbi:hypothetical protein ACNQ13_03320, partial [Mycoplasma sp. VS428]